MKLPRIKVTRSKRYTKEWLHGRLAARTTADILISSIWQSIILTVLLMIVFTLTTQLENVNIMLVASLTFGISYALSVLDGLFERYRAKRKLKNST